MTYSHAFVALCTGGMTLCLTAALAAQTAGAQPSGAPGAAQKVTLTGCVERADQIVDRGNLGTTVDSQMFVLMKTPASPASGTAPKRSPLYWLQGTQDFNDHVGHQVEVVGSVVNRAPGAVGTAGANAEQASATPSPDAPQPLRVESIKMISSRCPA